MVAPTKGKNQIEINQFILECLLNSDEKIT
jgi:hypothetical protein